MTVSHYPTGCSKWNPIEHRLFSQISRNWAGVPLRTWDTLLAFIRGTTTTSGLAVKAVFQPGDYPQFALGRAVPYGVYDVTANRGFVCVGTSGDTPAFAVDTISAWWQADGRVAFPTAGHLLLAGAMSVYMLIAIRYEERDLVATFGTDYEEYRVRVGMLTPRFRRRQV